MADLDDQLARHHRAAFGWALACCRWDTQAAEDVLQTSYLKMLDGRARFAGQAELKTFLFGVIRHTAREERRRRLIRRTMSLGLLDHANEPSIQAHGLTGILRDERSRELEAALRHISERQRHVLHLVFYQGLSIADAATVLGISLGSARTHYERGKAQLRRLLGKD